MKQIVDVPEGYMIKVVKEDAEPKNSNEISDNQFEFNGVGFKRGDVIIRNDGTEYWKAYKSVDILLCLSSH